MSLASRKLIQAGAGAAEAGDDDFANVVLLLDGDGTSGDDNNTFTDSSTNGFTVTESGSVVQGSFSPYGDNWSNYLDGTGDYVAAASSADFAVGTGDFTIEFWIYCQQHKNYTVYFDQRTTNFQATPYIYSDSSGLLRYYVSGTERITGSNALPLNEWTHVTVCRSGSSTKMFMNGVQEGSTWSDSTNYVQGGEYRVGNHWSNTAYGVNGYISNFRFVNGTAVYTSEFTPSTSPLTAITNTVLLTCQSNRFVDESTNNHTVTVSGTPKVTPFSPFRDNNARDITVDGGSGYFDANGDYLSLADTATLQMGNGDFTIEAWIYINTHKNYNHIYSYSYPYQLLVDSNGNLESYFNDTDNSINYISIQGSSVIPTGAWTHLAVVRNGSSFKQYVNGVEDGSTTSSATLGVPSIYDPMIGNWGTGNYAINGYISNVRIVKGTAVYTSAFTPPTAPLTAITNTSLLLNFQDAGIYDLSGINNVDTVGNAQIDTAVKKYGTGSIEFDGSGDYLKIPPSSSLDFGTGDFTIEGWFYKSATTALQVLASSGKYFTIGFNGNWILRITSATQIAFATYDGRSNAEYTEFSATTSLNTWHHFALVREGTGTNQTKFYLDGTLAGSMTVSKSLSDGSANGIYIGTDPAAINADLNGYIDDFRITKGIARYTSSFTPPDAELPKF